MDPITELLTRRIDTILPSKEGLEKLLRSGKKIRLYQGFDPSSPNLHIGHLVGLQQLRAFQDLGHEIIFLIGDFTGMIGDPTDKTAARQKLTRDQVDQNAQTYKEQAGRILRFTGKNPAQLMFNSTWLEKLTFADILELASSFTVQQMIERDMFQDRIKQSKPIFLHEFLYPLMVTYDAIALKVDLELGGNDQLFNMSVGRPLVKERTGKDKYAVTTKLLTDKAGRKIGKTTGNAINLFGHPHDLYGQIMSLPDETIIDAFLLTTTISLQEIKAMKAQLVNDPMAQKKRLAFEITSICHGSKNAQAAQDHFEKTVQHKETPTDIKTITINVNKPTILDLCRLSRVGESSGHIKRTIEQGGVEVNGQKITDINHPLELKSENILKFGKRTFIKVEVPNP